MVNLPGRPVVQRRSRRTETLHARIIAMMPSSIRLAMNFLQEALSKAAAGQEHEHGAW
jgi:hypothetical protein